MARCLVPQQLVGLKLKEDRAKGLMAPIFYNEADLRKHPKLSEDGRHRSPVVMRRSLAPLRLQLHSFAPASLTPDFYGVVDELCNCYWLATDSRNIFIAHAPQGRLKSSRKLILLR